MRDQSTVYIVGWRDRNKKSPGSNFPDDTSDALEPRNSKIEDYLLRHPEFIDGYIRKNAFKFPTGILPVEKQRTLNEFLLDLVGSIFQNMLSMDEVIQKVHEFATKLVDADRASLFLVDQSTKELYARIYEDNSTYRTNYHMKLKNEVEGIEGPTAKEIRFKIGKGIAGKVAETGETLNIPDAYGDPRFNELVDKQTGYKTKTILCMPIFIRGTIIAVVQMVNKKQGVFTQDDVMAFDQFGLYCGLALHHTKLYEKIQLSQEKFRVALEVVAYHRNCTDDEFDAATSGRTILQHPPADLSQFHFATMRVEDSQSIHFAAFMFVDLFGTSRFDVDTLYRFLITVKKNYRALPYHNWKHAFTVCHTMYCILKRNIQRFTTMEKLAMYVASLCHDLDHQGLNNDFLIATSSPLASIYNYSVLEHHHFNQSVHILQQDDKNILLKLDTEEYKEVLGHIKHCIIATDLSNYFPVRNKIGKLLAKNSFSWTNLDHRLMAEALTMTACDISACSKPWDVHAEITHLVFDEFYNQGDIEKKNGVKPNPMMDRSNGYLMPSFEIEFLSGICVECFEVLSHLLSDTNALASGCKSNLKRWKTILELKKKRQSRSENKTKTEDKKKS